MFTALVSFVNSAAPVPEATFAALLLAGLGAIVGHAAIHYGSGSVWSRAITGGACGTAQCNSGT